MASTKKRAPQEMLYLLIGVVALVLVVFLLFNQWRSYSQVQEDIAAEQSQVQLLEAHIETLLQLKAQEDEFRRHLALLEELMPEEPAEEQFINYIQGIADEYGAKLTQVRFGERIPSEDYAEMPLELSIEGSYHQLLAFLDSLRHGTRAVRVDDVRAGQGREELPQIRVDLSARAFYRQAGS